MSTPTPKLESLATARFKTVKVAGADRSDRALQSGVAAVHRLEHAEG